MRRYGIEKSYEKLKELTRGKKRRRRHAGVCRWIGYSIRRQSAPESDDTGQLYWQCGGTGEEEDINDSRLCCSAKTGFCRFSIAATSAGT